MLEQDLVHLVWTSSLPRPHVDAPVGRYAGDLVRPGHGSIVEADGLLRHGGPLARRRDALRRSRLRAFRSPAGHGGGVRSDDAPFTGADWALVAAVALMWGSSFLLIDVGVEHFAPELVALLRVGFGAATLAVVPAARRAVPREAWRGIAALGVVWMAAPFVLFGIAQQSIDSSLAGMLNGAAPLFTALIAGVVARQLPSGKRAAGLAIGFAGVVAISWPALRGADATAAGAGLVVLAVLLYGVAFNITGPLQRRHGNLPVIWRAQLVALVVLAPPGLASAPGSTFAWSSLVAVAVLGCLGTALAFVAMTTLVGRVGSTRASITIYFLPAVAIVLGALLNDEAIAAISIAGTALVTLGAWRTSRS